MIVDFRKNIFHAPTLPSCSKTVFRLVPKKKQAGIALISILIITFLISTIITAQLRTTYLGIKETQLYASKAQAWEYALSGEAYGIEALRKDLADSKNIDSLDEDWSFSKKKFEPPNGQLFISIEDLQSRFNVNNIISDDGHIDSTKVVELKRVLNYLNLHSNIANDIEDWLDQDSISSSKKSENNFYLKQLGSYSADSPIAEIGEIKILLSQLDNSDKLTSVLTALPEKTSININTAKPASLASISPSIHPQSVIEKRSKRSSGYTSREEFIIDNLSATSGEGFSDTTTSSRYFLISSYAFYNKFQITLESVVFRNPENSKITVIYRKIIPNAYIENEL